VYAEPRNTGDLDYAVVLDDDERYQDLLRRLRATGFELRTEQGDPPEQYPSLVVLERAGIRLDLLIAKTEFEHQAVARAIDVVSKDAVLRVVRLEDLLVYKLIASRSKDWNDIEALVEEQNRRKNTIDWRHVREQLRAFERKAQLDRAMDYDRSLDRDLER
jgi:predicted nucleotidyltransferase